MRQKGFTLVELLAVIVILGIITGISIPLIRNIQESNTTRKFTTYQDSLKVSAKLYVDSYEEDLFGREKSGCAVISYSQLENKSLLKDISVDKESCNSELTCVRVVKVDGKYTYYPVIGCGSMGADGKASSVTVHLPTSGTCEIATCGVDSKTIVTFTSDPERSDAITFKKKNVVIQMHSYTGFHEDMDVRYSFVNSTVAPANDRDDPTIVGGWQKLNINYIGGNEQKKKIENGEEIVLSSDTITTPGGLTGDYYVVLHIMKLRNLDGREWTTDVERGKYAYVGPFRVDNTKPVFGTSSVSSSATGYNSTTPKLNISVSDNYSTSFSMCTSYDNDTCSKSEVDIKTKQNGWVAYDATKTLSAIQNNYDGSNHTVYVSVGDAAGNYETATFAYRIASGYTLTYNSNGGSTCNPSSKSVYYDAGGTAPKWGTLCTPTRSNYIFDGWHAGSVNGDTVTSDTAATGNVTVYAKWREDRCYEMRVKGECGRWRECDIVRRSTSWTSESACDSYCPGDRWGKEGNRCVCYVRRRDPSCGCEYHRWSDWERVSSCTPEPDRVECRRVC